MLLPRIPPRPPLTSINSDPQRDGQLCYKELGWIEVWMNSPANKKALGVNPDLKIASCNMEVNQDFMFQGDGMHNSALLLPELIDDGVRLLVYAGNADLMCNTIVSITPSHLKYCLTPA